MWKDSLIVGSVIVALSVAALLMFGSTGLCGTPNVPYAFGALLGVAFIAFGLLVGAVQWAWRRTRSRER